MRIHVRYLGIHAEIAGISDEEVELQGGNKLGDLVKHILEKYPNMAGLLDGTQTAVLKNGMAVDDMGEALEEGDEVVFMPAAGGG